MANPKRHPAINQERLWDDLIALAAITGPDRPYGLSYVGSSGMAGVLSDELFALRGLGDETLAAAINRIGRMSTDCPRRGRTSTYPTAAAFCATSE